MKALYFIVGVAFLAAGISMFPVLGMFGVILTGIFSTIF